MSKIFHDVTLELSPEAIILPGDRPPEFRELKSIERGDILNLTNLNFGTHTGTHIDVPKHMYEDGLTVDRLEFDHLLGPARVIEIRDRRAIERADLERHGLEGESIILLKTDNCRLIKKDKFDLDFTCLTLDAAQYLAQAGIKTLGFDYFSIERLDNPKPEVHYALLSRNVVIIEGLDLTRVEPGRYEMVALPLKIKNGNGGPTRVVLIEET
jgi:arylformamidase